MGQSETGKRCHKPTGARQVYEALKAQIEDGVYRPRDQLPSTRALAAEFGASRTTITAAYDQLLAEGFIETRQGRRACVAPALRSGSLSRAGGKQAQRTARLSAFGRRLFELSGPPIATEPLRIDFRYGDVATADFPSLAWRRALTKVLTTPGPRSLRDQDPQGSMELRTALQAYLWPARSLRCGVDQIIIVNGSQQGLDLCSRVLLDPGDRFVIETPCYWAARHVFESAGAAPQFVPVDEEGLQTQALKDVEKARLCYVTPSHHYPLGHVLSAQRRAQLLQWADRQGAYVIDDDYDGEYRYDIGRIQPLHVFADGAHVIYLGTLSKTLSPLLRLGYVVVPPELIHAFRTAKRLTDRHSPSVEQAALANFLYSGAYERHVRKLRRKNAQRRSALLEAFAEHFGDAIEVQGSEAGLHVVAWFKKLDAAQEDAIARSARHRGVGIYPVSGLYENGRGSAKRRAGFVFGYAALEAREIRHGVASLASALRAQ
ncbi:PLP-dependent aminotransferase family protein [Bradyrhizobium ganzhouense]|uniref:MocR-like pyridoxine biosynthesis transcription factor PdxR n=1 Tax=Bradyrhizobium ganzhouense TaxID=1179767 RepID=UPI003CEA4A31